MIKVYTFFRFFINLVLYGMPNTLSLWIVLQILCMQIHFSFTFTAGSQDFTV